MTAHLGRMRHPGFFRLAASARCVNSLSRGYSGCSRLSIPRRLRAYSVVAECGVRGDEEIREAGGLQSQIGARTVGPIVLESLPAFAANINARRSIR